MGEERFVPEFHPLLVINASNEITPRVQWIYAGRVEVDIELPFPEFGRRNPTLAQRFDRYVSHLKDSFGEIGDQRLTVMAGIMVMDELSELQKRVMGMESEVVTLRKTRDDALTKADKNDSALTGALGGLAQRMEALAEKLAVKAE